MWYKGGKCSPICCCRSRRVNGCHKQSSDLCHYVAKSEVACEVKEAFLGFDDMSNDRRAAAIFVVVLPVSIYSCLLILHGEQPVLFGQFVKKSGWCCCAPVRGVNLPRCVQTCWHSSLVASFKLPSVGVCLGANEAPGDAIRVRLSSSSNKGEDP